MKSIIIFRFSRAGMRAFPKGSERVVMPRTDIRHVLSQHTPIGSEVVIAGWLRSVRTSKGGFAFLAVHDGSCFDPLQVVAEATLPNYESQIVKLTTGCAVQVEGTVVASQGKNQDREIHATTITLIGAIDDPETYPIAKKRHTFEYLRSVAHLRPRTNTFGAIARVRNSITQAVHGYFHRNGFVWVNTPIITASDCEGAGQLFRVSTLDALNPPRTPANATSGSIIQNSARCRLVLESSARNVGPNVYTFDSARQ